MEETEESLRIYARVAGSILVLLGLAGLTLAPAFVFVPKLSLVESFFHAFMGAIFLYVGFLNRDAAVVRSVVGGLGVLLLVGKAFMIVTGLAFGGEGNLFGPVEVTCIVGGLTSVLAARYLKGDDRTRMMD